MRTFGDDRRSGSDKSTSTVVQDRREFSGTMCRHYLIVRGRERHFVRSWRYNLFRH